MAIAAQRLSKKAVVHVMLDTGMCRMGLDEQELLELIEVIKNCDQVEIEGLYTHHAAADESDKTFSHGQLKRFESFLKVLRERGFSIPIIHAANSVAAIDLDESHYDMLRVGIAVYGYQPGVQMLNKPDLRPSMKLVSYLTAVKKISKGSYVGYGCTWQATEDTTIGLVPIGYGDGYDRRLSNKGQMKIGQTLVPVVGRVSMDLTVIDLSMLVCHHEEVSVGQEVVIIDNHPDAPNSVEAIAAQLQTIPYEIVTRLGPRITRIAMER